MYPVADGYEDSVDITGTLAAAPGRVRATAIVSIGTRVLKTWVLSSTGPFSFRWDGKAGTAVVAGNATITVCAEQDDGTLVSASRPLTISAKKVTALTYVKTVTDANSLEMCVDADDPYAPRFFELCRTIFGPGFVWKATTFAGKLTSGGVMAWSQLTLPTAVRNSLRPPLVTVTAKYLQTGTALNSLSVVDGLNSDTLLGPEKVFTRAATVTVRGELPIGSPVATWLLYVAPGHNINSAGTTRVTVTYYALR